MFFLFYNPIACAFTQDIWCHHGKLGRRLSAQDATNGLDFATNQLFAHLFKIFDSAAGSRIVGSAPKVQSTVFILLPTDCEHI